MADEAKDVAPIQVEVKTDTTPEAKVEVEVKEPTAGEVTGAQAPTKKESDTIPISAFLDEKKGRKEAERARDDAQTRVSELEQSIKAGATKAEVSADIEAIAKEYDVDAGFLSKLASAMQAKAKTAVDEKLRPLEEKDREAKINVAFKGAYEGAMERMPEFKAIVNPDVIKALSLDPRNANKTFTQIIEEAYGNAVPGKRSIESTVAGGGKEPAPLDMTRARKDNAYFAEIMANPQLKAEYNAAMLKRGL